jgi:hypothetical protein
VSAEWTLTGVSLLHLVKVIVEPAVACNDAMRVVLRSRMILACLLPRFKNHLGVFGSISFPFFLIKFGNLVVNLFLDIGVWYGAVEDGVARSAKLSQLICSLVTP